MILKKLNCLFICIGFAVSAFGAVKMPSIFSDNMMFQRDMPAPVWGTAEPNADILVEFGGKKVSTKAEISGKWRVVLPKMKADKTPKEMTVFENSMPAKKIKNILVGEVWGCQRAIKYGMECFRNGYCRGDKKSRRLSSNALF